MLETKVGQLEEKAFDRLLLDAFYWLTDSFGDRSILLNKTSYIKKYSPLRRYTFKQHLRLVWDYEATRLPWYYYGQWAEYAAISNSLIIHCDKKFTIQFVLELLFHEYRHSQQSMYQYVYFKGTYENHPLEIEADAFAAEWVPEYYQTRLQDQQLNYLY